SPPPPLVTLYLIRHGETVVNQKNCVQGKRIDPPLNERGQKQAGYVGLRFKGAAVDWVVTSTSKRAIETGAAIHRHHSDVPFDRYDALNELEFGDLEGTHVTAGYNDLIAKWDIDHIADLAAPGERGESPSSCAQRAMPCLTAVVDEAAAEGRKSVCVVIHSRLIQILMALMIDGSLTTMALYKQKKAAVNAIDV
ncbi:phosphoglycerate mutase-like protein, partial [Martensiomyces pterosporus]